MGRLIPAWCLLVACSPRAPVDDAYPEVALRPPTLDAASVVCDAEEARWELELRATAWTGGATTAWTVDGAYIELHDLDRVSWEPDGTYEILALTLPIVDDWREVTDDSTVFTCASDPSGVVTLQDVDGATVACRAWGPDPDRLGAELGSFACDVPLETQP